MLNWYASEVSWPSKQPWPIIDGFAPSEIALDISVPASVPVPASEWPTHVNGAVYPSGLPIISRYVPAPPDSQNTVERLIMIR